MPRYEQYGRLDSAPVEDGDPGFIGVNMQDDPSTLPPGIAARGYNTRCTSGGQGRGNVAGPRGGFVKLPWTNVVSEGAQTPLPFGTVYGAHIFDDPNSIRWAIIAADGAVYRTADSNGATPIPLPPGVVIDYPVTFEQTYSGLIMFRGESREELIMVNVDEGFVPVTQVDNLVTGVATPNPANGNEAIPPAVRGDWIGDRLFLPYEKDLLGVSDFLNPTRYAGVRAAGRINQGSSDSLVRFMELSEGVGIAFKTSSLYAITGVTGDLADMQLTGLTKEYGLCAADSCVHFGSDIWFLVERRGICSIKLTDQNKIQGVDVPASVALQPVIDRIDWRNASLAQGVWHNNKGYWAVPLDDSTALGPNMAADLNYGGGAVSVGGLEGQLYRWTKGANDISLTHAGGTATENGDYVAPAGGEMILTGTAGTDVTADLAHVYADVNNAVLVYDFLKGQWAGVDIARGLMVKAWLKLRYNGAERLFFISADGFINLYEDGPFDEVAKYSAQTYALGNYGGGEPAILTTPGTRFYYTLGANDAGISNGTEYLSARSGTFVARGDFILVLGVVGTVAGTPCTATLRSILWTIDQVWPAFDWISRGYTGATSTDDPDRNAVKRWLNGSLTLKTWFPEYSISVLTDGAAEETNVAEDETRDRTRYDRPAYAANYDASNINDDHAVAYRQDYSVVLGEATTASGAIEAGVLYFAEDLDTPGAQLRYNGVTLTTPITFTGVAGVTTFTILSGAPVVYGPGNYVFLGDNGIDFDLLQEAPVQLAFRNAGVRGRMVQLRVQATQGQVFVASSNVDGVKVGKPTGRRI